MLRGPAMALQPGDRPAGAHEGAVVAFAQRRHDPARGPLVGLGIGGPHDREIGDLVGPAVEHEAAGPLGDATPHEGAAPDLAPEIAPPLGLLVAEADRLHRDAEQPGQRPVRRHPGARPQPRRLDVGDDRVGQQPMLAGAPCRRQHGAPARARHVLRSHHLIHVIQGADHSIRPGPAQRPTSSKEARRRSGSVTTGRRVVPARSRRLDSLGAALA